MCIATYKYFEKFSSKVAFNLDILIAQSNTWSNVSVHVQMKLISSATNSTSF